MLFPHWHHRGKRAATTINKQGMALCTKHLFFPYHSLSTSYFQQHVLRPEYSNYASDLVVQS
jgi:hypothetical protein